MICATPNCGHAKSRHRGTVPQWCRDCMCEAFWEAEVSKTIVHGQGDRSRDEEYAALIEKCASLEKARSFHLHRADTLENAIRDYLFEQRREAAGGPNADRHREAWRRLKTVVKWGEDSPEINCSRATP